MNITITPAILLLLLAVFLALSCVIGLALFVVIITEQITKERKYKIRRNKIAFQEEKLRFLHSLNKSNEVN